MIWTNLHSGPSRSNPKSPATFTRSNNGRIVTKLGSDECSMGVDMGLSVHVTTTRLILSLCLACFGIGVSGAADAQPSTPQAVPQPRIDRTHTSDWIFAYKFNGADFPTNPVAQCRFGGTPQTDKGSQHYAATWSGVGTLVDQPGLIGSELSDPLGATFDEIYNGNLFFVAWNDQFDTHPSLPSCKDECPGPWGHSKGILAWDRNGSGLLLQVTTPSWPGAGSSSSARADEGNSLGCISKNNIKFAQHFLALRLTPTDTAAVLDALANASVATDPANPQLVRNGGPTPLQERVNRLGRLSPSTQPTDVVLSTGIRLISKPSLLHVPPWQFVSSMLGSIPLRTATWWSTPRIPTTEQGRLIICWRDDLAAPGRVEVALNGSWSGRTIGLGGAQNHAKIGVSLDPAQPLTIFGDLNQQGRLTGKCESSQNGRGGLFFVVRDPALHQSVSQLLTGATAPTTVPVANRKPRAANARTRQSR